MLFCISNLFIWNNIYTRTYVWYNYVYMVWRRVYGHIGKVKDTIGSG